MQSAVEYINIIIRKEVVIECKEVKFPDKSYSKLVTSDGQVAIVYSPSYGIGWSTDAREISIQHQLIFDSRIILSLLSEAKWSKKEYTEFMKFNFPDFNIIDIHDFSYYKKLKVMFIPENTKFRINEYDGAESIEIYNPDLYFTS
jgi:hypothetical protein